ncbi:MAG: hypothetical protein J6K58_02640 [Lachnospiraceae bacterium]|nr:hypothetical protein [Lachnospiraceae bacterium]
MEKWKQLCGKIGKDRFLILIIGGLLLLVITYPLPSGTKGEADQDKTIQNISSRTSGSTSDSQKAAVAGEDNYIDKMESRLSRVLSNIYGAGKVKVFISLSDYGTSVVEKDVSYTRNNEEKEGGDLQNTVTLITENNEETVYTADEKGNDVPFVNKITAPKVEGVLVVAEGGGNQSVVQEMKEAIMALFGIEEHKIKVVKMKGEER